MTKHFAILFLLISLIVSLGLSSNIATSENHSAFINPTATAKPKLLAKIEKIELDRNEVLIPCPPPPDGFPKREGLLCPDDDGLVRVFTYVSNPKNRALSFQYTVSGGRIIGKGENVIWDLKGVRYGKYTITVAINGGRGVSSETKTQEITIGECECPIICYCPTITVTGGGSVKVGEPLFFTANVSGGGVTNISYKWTISIGEITEGQGTSEIIVKTTDKMIGKTIEATVEIGGTNPSCSCQTMASETGSVVREYPKN